MFRSLFNLLTPREKVRAALVFGCILCQGLIEAVGIGAVLPFVELLSSPEGLNKYPFLLSLQQASGAASHNEFVVLASLGLVAIFLAKNAFVIFSDYFQTSFSMGLQSRLSTTVLETYMKKDYPFFFQQNSSVLVRYVNNEVGRVCQGVVLYGLIFLSEIVTLCFLLVLMFLANPGMAATFLAAGALVVAGLYIFIRQKMRRYGERSLALNNQMVRLSTEALAGIKDIKVLCREAFFVDRFRLIAAEGAEVTTYQRVLANMPRPVIEVILMAGVAALIFFALRTYGSLALALPTLSLYAVAAYRLTPSAQRLVSALGNFRNNAPAVEALHSAFQESPAPRASLASAAPIAFRECLELRKIGYRYPGAKAPALENLSLTVRQGETLGIVGRSGAGKTTLVDILLGLLSPSSGALALDGRELGPADIRSLQQSMGYVPQNIFLSDATILQNIALGIPQAQIRLDQAERAAKAAQIWDLVQGLPQKWDTPVGERGIQLSGGQRQRIGIARALYHNPAILVLDEATSALDSITELEFNKAVGSIRGGKTILLIAHRLSTVENCDRIIVMEGGKLSAEGTYQQLLASSAEFKKLANLAHSGTGVLP